MMLQRKLLEDHLQTTTGEHLHLRQRVVSYIESCQVEDGGYFFARIAPGSLMDTFYAVATLAILGRRPQQIDRVVNYVNGLSDYDVLSDWRGLFAACEVLHTINAPLTVCREAAIRLLESKGLPVDDLPVQSLYVEVLSELETLAQAVAVTLRLGLPFDHGKLKSYLSNVRNADGSFGSGGRSRLASSFYATQICRMLGWSPLFFDGTLAFLRHQEQLWPIAFIEDLFWLCGGLFNLGAEIERSDEAIDFVLGCERGRGGFSRSAVIGIQTLESTFHGISVLRATGYL